MFVIYEWKWTQQNITVMQLRLHPAGAVIVVITFDSYLAESAVQLVSLLAEGFQLIY
jgi:hypothetical protein